MKNRIIIGYVIQVCDDDGKCQSQEFTAGEESWEDDQDGAPLDEPDNFDPLKAFPLEMVQPKEA